MTKRQDGSIYGKLQTLKNPEAYRMWLSRFDEPEPLPQDGMQADFILDDEDDKRPVLAAEIVEFLEGTLPPRYFHVLKMRFFLDMTLAEVAEAFGVSRERVRQYEQATFRLIKRHSLSLFGTQREKDEAKARYEEYLARLEKQKADDIQAKKEHRRHLARLREKRLREELSAAHQYPYRRTA